jgi:hypothetical protein
MWHKAVLKRQKDAIAGALSCEAAHRRGIECRVDY